MGEVAVLEAVGEAGGGEGEAEGEAEGGVEGEAVGEVESEAVGEARVESLVGDAGEAVVVVAGASDALGAPGGGAAHRGRLLEGDADAAARGVFDGLPGHAVEQVAPQAATERPEGSKMGAGARATHPSDRRTWHRSTRRTMEGGIVWTACGSGMGGCGGSCVCLRARSTSVKDQGRKCLGRDQGRKCSGKDQGRNCSRKDKGRNCSGKDQGRNALAFYAQHVQC